MRHHRPVPPNLHLDPAALRAAAAAVAAVLPQVAELDPDDLTVLAGLPGGAALVAEHDRIAAAVARRVRELADLVDGLGAVADGAASAELHAVGALRAVAR